MQIHCHQCRTPMHVPDEAQRLGGVFTCPVCRSVSTVAPVAVAAVPRPHVAQARPSDKRPAYVIGALVGSIVLAYVLPWVAVPIGLGTTTMAAFYIAHPPFRARVDHLLKLGQPRRWLASLTATAIGGWSLIVLFAFGLWVGTGGPERAKQERDAREAAAKAEREAKNAAEKAARAAAEDQRRAEEAAAKAARAQELIANASEAATAHTAGLDAIDSLVKDEKWTDAKAKLESLSATVAEYRMLDPVPAALRDPLERHDRLASRIDAVIKVLDAARGLETNLKSAAEITKGTRSGESWKQAQAMWKEAQSQLKTLEKAEPHAKKYVPPGLDKQRKAVEKKLAEANRIVAAYERKQLEHEAYLALCGEEPVCGGWDGECVGIEFALKQVAHDPDSIDVENCSAPKMTKENCWVTSCNVRGRNMLGAMILDRKTFSMSKLGVSEI